MSSMAVCDRRSSRRRRLRMRLLAGVLGVVGGWIGMSNTCHAQQHYTSQWALTNTPLNVDLQTNRQKLEMVVNTSRELIAFGTQVSNEVAGDCLEKLRSINFVELTVEQTKPDKWTITDAGQNYLSQQHSEANS